MKYQMNLIFIPTSGKKNIPLTRRRKEKRKKFFIHFAFCCRHFFFCFVVVDVELHEEVIQPSGKQTRKTTKIAFPPPHL
jgi:hypothetical protein